MGRSDSARFRFADCGSETGLSLSFLEANVPCSEFILCRLLVIESDAGKWLSPAALADGAIAVIALRTDVD